MSHARRNFWVHAFEGGIYMGGMAFLSSESVMPSMLQSLGGAAWMVALMPVAIFIGFFLPGVFIAPLIDRMPRLLPFVLFFGFFQRLPFLLAALALFWMNDETSSAILWIVFAAPLVSGLAGGCGSTAWMEMVTRMVPEEDRATGWAIRNFIRAGIGVGAGFAVHALLEAYPGRVGYAWLHAITFAFLMLSFLVMAFMKEPPEDKEPQLTRQAFARELGSLPGIIWSHQSVRRFFGVRLLGPSFLVLAPFMAIHALKITGRPEQALGYLVTASLIGNVVGNFVSAWMGKRWGGKSILFVGRVVTLLLCAQLFFTGTFPLFCVAFFLFGFIYAHEMVGDLTFGVELCPTEKRPFYLSALNFGAIFGLLLTTGTGALIETRLGTFTPAMIACMGFTAISLVLIARIPEPRNRKA